MEAAEQHVCYPSLPSPAWTVCLVSVFCVSRPVWLAVVSCRYMSVCLSGVLSVSVCLAGCLLLLSICLSVRLTAHRPMAPHIVLCFILLLFVCIYLCYPPPPCLFSWVHMVFINIIMSCLYIHTKGFGCVI